jgi:hypothetical protein
MQYHPINLQVKSYIVKEQIIAAAKRFRSTIFSGARASGEAGPPNDFSTQKFSQNAPLLASPAKKC